MVLKNIHQHSLLANHGGAARIRRLLAFELEKSGWDVSASCEIYDPENSGSGNSSSGGDGSQPIMETKPAGLGALLEPDTLCHLHSTADWVSACFSLIRQERGRLHALITLHDFSVLTGAGPSPAGQQAPLECFVSPSDCLSYHAGSAGVGSNIPDAALNMHPGARPNTPHGIFSDEIAVQEAHKQALIELQPTFVSPSAWLGAQVKKAMPQLRCNIIPNGVEENIENAEQARQALGIAPGAKMVLFAAHGGLLSGLKGAARWKNVWVAIKRAVPKAVGFMVGGETASRELDLIEWPYVPKEKMALLMAAADLLVYPSLWDNHPLVVLEAMSAAAAVSSYSTGGIPEQVRHGETGLLAPERDEAELIANSIRILATPRLSREMGRAGREVWEKYFQARQMAVRYQNLYLKILEQKGG